MTKYIKSIFVLFAICSVVAVLLAATNYITEPIIVENENKAANEALLVVYPDGTGFEKIDISSYELPSTIKAAYNEAGGGYVIRLETTGYQPGMVIMCGIDSNGTVIGTVCLSSGETLGYEKTYGEGLLGANFSTIEEISTIAGATRTTSAYKNAVRDAISATVIFGGGSVDFRSEEEILLDNLSAALPGNSGNFGDMFPEDELPGVLGIYRDGDIGYVFIYNDRFIGTDVNGKVITPGFDAETVEIIEGYAKIYLDSFNDEDYVFNLDEYEGLKNVYTAKRTGTGNYVIKMKAAGFGINGDEWYNPSGEHIIIKIALTPEGKIISCYTEYQNESEGFGAECGKPSFYKQFNGKDETNFKDVDAISGATITTNGYKTAISRAFDALKILKGENA